MLSLIERLRTKHENHDNLYAHSEVLEAYVKDRAEAADALENPMGTRDPATAELITDKLDPQAYRVEAIDSDGGVQVTMFSGPSARDRTIAFAGNYYAAWGDPQGLTGY